MTQTGEIVKVLELEPELAEGLDPEQEEIARGLAVARVDEIAPGEWQGEEAYPATAGHLGLLVIDGLMCRSVEVGNRTCAELLGPGDFLRPWVKVAPHSSVPLEARWTVVDTAHVAVLDRRFASAVARFPELAGAILDRVMMRSRWLAFHMAVTHLKRIESRLLVVFWHFADRWGRVGPEGVTVPLRVTHQILAGVVGAQRPSVTTALSNLRRSGLIERQQDGSWLLHGSPPAEMNPVETLAAGKPFRDSDVSG
ncbi:MAG TPA: Crp/Fnr family transcriptional regulator [Thermoleophilaceae bacterium]|nr:Crp/Fnr family transcriptional regulator [Thermoleophilaceae bacterium]